VINEYQEHFISYYILISCILNFKNKVLLLFPNHVQTAAPQDLLQGSQLHFKFICVVKLNEILHLYSAKKSAVT
jgi:hypothetical protein